jgi:hypothetical protein
VGLIVGGGPGLEHLKTEAGDLLGKKIFLTGAKPRADLLDHLCAMDVGSLPQSADGVGSFRYTTKISEYIESELPFVTGQIPLAYDFGSEALWRLPGTAPWTLAYTEAFSQLLDNLNLSQIQQKRLALKSFAPIFDKLSQKRRVTDFVSDCLTSSETRSPKV